MGRRVQSRGGSSDVMSGFVGAVREITVDTTNKRIVLHDGVTPGGIPTAKLSDLNNINNDVTVINDKVSVLNSSDNIVGSVEYKIKQKIDIVKGGSTKTLKDLDDQNTVIAGDIALVSDKVDSMLSASAADKDSFAEIVSLINTVDTENDNAFAGYVLSNNTRVSNVETSVANETTNRNAAVDALKAYVDNKFLVIDCGSIV